MKERTIPEQTALTLDLCDHYHMIGDHRCFNYARETVELDKPTQVGGKVMSGTYHSGIWRFCRMHYRIFQRDRR